MKTSSFEALSLLTHTFHFVDLKPIDPMYRDIGIKRVISVCINEVGCPEILLANNVDDESPQFYYLDQLQISPANQFANSA